MFVSIYDKGDAGRKLVGNKEEKEKRKGKGAEVKMADIRDTLERNCVYKAYHCIQ